MGLRMTSINAEDRGAVIGEEEAREWALGGTVRSVNGESAISLVRYLELDRQARSLESRPMEEVGGLP